MKDKRFLALCEHALNGTPAGNITDQELDAFLKSCIRIARAARIEKNAIRLPLVKKHKGENWHVYSATYMADSKERVFYVQARTFEEAENFMSCIKVNGIISGKMVEAEI